MTASLAEHLATDTALRERFFKTLSDADAQALLSDWRFWGRPEQMEPEDYSVWLILTGRGWGKTRTGAETIADRIEQGRSKRIAFVAATAADARDTMVDELRADAGFLTVCERRGIRAIYQSSKRRIVVPDYGAVIRLFSAEEPERMRGPQFDTIWYDEFCAYERTKIDAIWSNSRFGLRHGKAQIIITTTPKPIKKLREIMKMPKCVVTVGSTYDNMLNLSDEYKETVIKPLEGSRLSKQEVYGAILDDNPDALWNYDVIERNRIHLDDVPSIERMVIGVDPAGDEEGHEIGIVGAGRSGPLKDGLKHAYVFADHSLHGTPEQWATAAIDLYDELEADAIVVERNYGGQMVKSTIDLVAQKLGHEPIRIEEVVATRGKVIRAEPISALDHQNRVHHVEAEMITLEDQMVDFEQGGENDRVDARVWAITSLLGRVRSKASTF